ncbi:histidine kinase [Bernardetia sp. ABR2-2B]|uniref:sensor histidine kinase n=1 Tax=Bernardetia sp. ABR2-2B TaxID=3127472 RepID=UPI0030D5DC4B
MIHQLRSKKIAGIRLDELAFVIVFYIFSGYSYYVTLWLNRPAERQKIEDLFNFLDFFDSGLLNYGIKLILTIPIWWLVFRGLKKHPLWLRLSVHLVALPIFAFTFRFCYYKACDYLGFYHLQGNGQIWDIYIPALFYILQFGIFHAYHYYSQNQKQLKEEAILKEAALQSELSALKAQLNPHFLYNAFNTINAAIPPEQEKTRQLIAELSDLFRYQLKASRQDLVTVSEELEFVKSYLALEKARFENRLEVEINVDKTVLNKKIPPMILQPLVENAVKHGISPLIEGGKVVVAIYEKNEKLHFEISDTGIGIKEEKNTVFEKGVGLTNTKLRLEKMYNSELIVEDNYPKGLIVKFEL